MLDKRGFRTEFKHNGFEIYSHPCPFEGERWYSIYRSNGDPFKRDIDSLEEAKEELFTIEYRIGDTGDDEILNAIGADESSVNIGSAIEKEYGDVVDGIRRPGLDQVLVGGPGGGHRLMQSMGVNKGSVCSGFGTDMSYVKSVAKTDNDIFKNMSRVT